MPVAKSSASDKRIKLPGVLSFQRGTVISDALFYNVFADGSREPLYVVRHGIRGTQNVGERTEANQAGAVVHTAKRAEVSNIQTTDTAKLAPTAVALGIEFHVRFLDLEQALFACAPGKGDSAEDTQAVRQAVTDFVRRAKGSNAIDQLAERYARNIANARFAWRNRMIAESVRVSVSSLDGSLAELTFDALDTPMLHFDEITQGEQQLAALIARGLRGDRQATLIVRTEIRFGSGSVEVFPSQNYLEDKPKGFARPLYFVGNPTRSEDAMQPRRMGQAALRDQKVGNALRTIDTWYAAYATRRTPLAVEPNGASLDAQQFFRSGAASGFKLLCRMPELDPSSNDGLFVLACLVRGGVFSGGEK